MAWHIQQAQGRQWVEALTPRSLGSTGALGRSAHKRIVRLARFFMRCW